MCVHVPSTISHSGRCTRSSSACGALRSSRTTERAAAISCSVLWRKTTRFRAINTVKLSPAATRLRSTSTQPSRVFPTVDFAEAGAQKHASIHPTATRPRSRRVNDWHRSGLHVAAFSKLTRCPVRQTGSSPLWNVNDTHTARTFAARRNAFDLFHTLHRDDAYRIIRTIRYVSEFAVRRENHPV